MGREYEYMRLRGKPLPWGDGNHTLFHIDEFTSLPDGYVKEEGHLPIPDMMRQPSARKDGTRKRKTSNKRNNTFIKKQLKYYSCRNQLKKYNPKFVKRKKKKKKKK